MSRVEKLWKERSPGILDEYLHKRGLKRKPVAKDGCCLFRAVAEQVYTYTLCVIFNSYIHCV